MKYAPLLGLAIAPALVAVALLVAPHLVVGDGAAAAITFGGGALAMIASLAVASRTEIELRPSIAIAIGGAIVLGACALVAAPPPGIAIAVDAALVAIGYGLGGAIGRRVQHAGHLLPACVVAAAADVASVIHPAGPTHAIASNERALSLLAIGFPVAGSRGVAPVIGVGDIVFIALIFGVVAAHRLSWTRAVVAVVLGVGVAGTLSSAFARAMPAIVTIGAAVLLLVPEARRVRPADRRTSALAIVAGIAAVVAVLFNRWTAR